MRTEMKEAYELIGQFKRGLIANGAPVTEPQQRLIRLLSEDLGVDAKDVSVEDLIKRVARADTHWNRRTQEVVDRFYTHQRAGHMDKAERERSAFLTECPSVWYCGIVSDL